MPTREVPPLLAHEAPPATLAALLDSATARHADSPAIIGERSTTFAELADAAVLVASGLAGRGLGTGDRVALALPGGEAALVVLAGVARAGTSAVLIDPRAPERRREELVDQAGARLLVTLDGTPSRHCDSATVADVLAPTATRPSGSPLPPAEAYVIFTSGSTGTPKGVSVSHGAIAAHATAAARFFELDDRDRVLQFASLAFDVAQEEIWPTWAAGAAIVVKPDELLEPYALGQVVRERGVTVLQLPTAYWRAVVAETGPDQDASFAGVRSVIVGGEAAGVSDLLAHRGSALGGATLVNGYGPTETVITSVAYTVGPTDPLPAGATALPIGTPFPGRTATVVATDGSVAGPGDEGELYVSGVLADGYLDREDVTDERFLTGVPGLPPGQRAYRTGDLVRVLPAGVLEFVRRVDDQVKLRGHRVELGEVDSHLRSLAGITDAASAIVLRPDAEPLLGAAVVCAPGESYDEARTAALLGEQLPPAFVPTVWVRVAALPVTAAGKVDRSRVAEQLSASLASGEAPRSSGTQQRSDPRLTAVRAIWSEVLGVSDPSPDDDFLGSGGDSLLAVRFAARARRQGLTVSPAQVLRLGTLAAVAEAADPLESGHDDAKGATGSAPALALLPAQHRWLRDGPLPDLHHFSLNALLRIPADLPDDAVTATARVLLQQHAVLSSRFELDVPRVHAGAREAADVATREVLGGGDLAEEIRTAAERIQAGLDPASGDVFRLVRLVHGGEHRLLVVVHHLVLDGWSMALLVDEVETALTRWVGEGEAALDAPTASVGAYAAAIDAYLRTPEARADARAWLDGPWQELAPLERRGSGPGLLPTVVTVRSWVDAGSTDAILRRLPRSTGRPVDLLRASIMTAVAEWDGRPTVAIDVYDNQRVASVGDLDLSRTVGYLQSTHPEIAHVPGGGPDAVTALLTTSRATPFRRYGFDALRFLSPEDGERVALSALPRPRLRLNYRSQLHRLEQRTSGSVVSDSPEDTGAHRAPTQRERYDLMFEGDVIEDRFLVGVKFSTDHFARDEMQTLCARVATLMTETAGRLCP